MRLKVYGHMRSGNNLLMCCLKYNFYPDEDLSSRVDTNPKKVCTWPDGHTERKTPWGKLFGGHMSDPRTVDLHDAVYIYRNVEDTIDSYIAFVVSLGRGAPERGNVREQINRHHTNWIDNAYTVKYEDLLTDHVSVLKGIADHFGLSYPSEWYFPERKIGWNPRK